MARRNKGRAINGILLLDKTKGVSSNHILQVAKRLYNANKAGHTGALDPLATGMLPICFGEATKFSQFLLDSDKSYRVKAQLGVRTNTSDAEGEIVSQREVTVTKEQILVEMEYFRGETLQVPSMFSALKYQGKPLYEYARQGIEVPRKARSIQVYQIELLAHTKDSIELEVHCSKGTYIRTIIDDLGERLGCGAHVTELRRLSVANYPAQQMVTLEQLMELARANEASQTQGLPLDYSELDALLLPMDTALMDLPQVKLIPELAHLAQQGQAVQVLSAPNDGLLRLYNAVTQQFLGIGELDDQGRVAPKRLVVYPLAK